MRLEPFVASLLALKASATVHFDRNLVYRSPVAEVPELARDTSALHERAVQHARRQTQSAEKFNDEHYTTFYGSNMANAPTVWSGGINFTHSVASGDPFDSSVLLWTRSVPVSPAGSTALPDQSVPVCVSYKISDSQDLKRPVDSGEAFTSYDVDFTVKVEATKLQADKIYYFQFADCTNPSNVSPLGRTRTLPHPDTAAGSVNNGKGITLAVFSCSQYQVGFFNAYGVAAHNTSADIFVHLGDYIYESVGNGGSIGRAVLGRELATIHDYRQRLGQYRTDASLVAAHQNYPWITVWYDDHEVADNSWKAGTADSNDTAVGCAFSASGACFTDRKLAAVRAYHEWLPIRQVQPDNQLRIWRNFQIGKLLDLTMLDTRQYNRDLTDIYYNTEFIHDSLATLDDRSLMGADQEKWLRDVLSESKQRHAVWRIIGQQIVFTQLNESGSYNMDAWDGYQANRARVMNHLYNNNIGNNIVLAGDSHANWVSDLARPNDTKSYDPKTGKGSIGVEFAGTAVTSGSSLTTGIGTAPATGIAHSKEFVTFNEQLQWSEITYRGFFTLKLTTDSATAIYYAMNNNTHPNLDAFQSATFVVKNGENRLQRPVAGGKVLAGVLKSTALGF